MTVRDLFRMTRQANEFKALIGESETKFNVVIDEHSLGMVSTFDEFKALLNEEFHPEAKGEIIMREIKMGYRRQFKIPYTFDGESRFLSLYAE